MSRFELQHNARLPRATIEAIGIVSFLESSFPLTTESVPLAVEVDDLRLTVSKNKQFWGEISMRKLEYFSVFRTEEDTLLVVRFVRANRQHYLLRLWAEPEQIHVIANRLRAGWPRQDLPQMAPVDAARTLSMYPSPAVGIVVGTGALGALVAALRVASLGLQGQRPDGVPFGVTFALVATVLLVFAATKLRHSFIVHRIVDDA